MDGSASTVEAFRAGLDQEQDGLAVEPGTDHEELRVGTSHDG